MLINNLLSKFNWFNKTNFRFRLTYTFCGQAIICFFTQTKNFLCDITFVLLCYTFKEFHPKKTKNQLLSSNESVKLYRIEQYFNEACV
jgi:hypothetical protein